MGAKYLFGGGMDKDAQKTANQASSNPNRDLGANTAGKRLKKNKDAKKKALEEAGKY